MDSACLCPSPPPNGLTDDKLKRDKHTPRIPVHGCRLVVCSWYVQLVNIESFSSRCAITSSRELSCIRQDHRSCQELSTGKHLRTCNDRRVALYQSQR